MYIYIYTLYITFTICIHITSTICYHVTLGRSLLGSTRAVRRCGPYSSQPSPCGTPCWRPITSNSRYKCVCVKMCMYIYVYDHFYILKYICIYMYVSIYISVNIHIHIYLHLIYIAYINSYLP
jgi:hypothetical protein